MISIHFHKYCCICLWHLTQNFSSWFYRRIRKGHIERRFSSLILQAVTAAEPLFRTSLVTDIAVLPAESWWGDQVWPPLTKYLGLLPTDSEESLFTNTSLLSLAVLLPLPSRELACHRQRQPGAPTACAAQSLRPRNGTTTMVVVRPLQQPRPHCPRHKLCLQGRQRCAWCPNTRRGHLGLESWRVCGILRCPKHPQLTNLNSFFFYKYCLYAYQPFRLHTNI